MKAIVESQTLEPGYTVHDVCVEVLAQGGVWQQVTITCQSRKQAEEVAALLNKVRDIDVERVWKPVTIGGAL